MYIRIFQSRPLIYQETQTRYYMYYQYTTIRHLTPPTNTHWSVTL